jgi:hypothetical protein
MERLVRASRNKPELAFSLDEYRKGRLGCQLKRGTNNLEVFLRTGKRGFWQIVQAGMNSALTYGLVLLLNKLESMTSRTYGVSKISFLDGPRGER